MKCFNCDFYISGHQYNACSLTQDEYFYVQNNCTLINDDGTVNYEDEYFSDLEIENNGTDSPFDE